MSAQVGRGDCCCEGLQGSVSLAVVGAALSKCNIVVISTKCLELVSIFNKHDTCAGCEATTVRFIGRILCIVVSGVALMRGWLDSMSIRNALVPIDNFAQARKARSE